MLRAVLGLTILLAAVPAAAQPQKPDPCSGEPAAPSEPAPTEAAPAPGGAPPVEATARLAEPPPAPAPVAPEVTPATASTAAPTAPADADRFHVAMGGFVQPYLRFRQNDPVVQNDEDGFSVRRARLTARGTGRAGDVEVGMYFEAEMIPQFSLMDAYGFAKKPLPKDGQVAVYAGQMFAPFSRQTMLSDTKRAFVEKPELTSIAPDRQIGTKVMLRAPGAPWLQAWGGVFNGEGRNQIQNIDEHFMWVGRLELRPFGWDTPMEESAFVGNYLTIAADYAHNVISGASGEEKDTYLGVEIAGAWRGLSGTAEYLQEKHEFTADSGLPTYLSNGDVVQLSYLLPLQGFWSRRLEVGARLEEIDRNDTVPITMKGDPNQSLRYYTLGVSFYQWQHSLKLQATASHIQELENRDRNGNDASYNNDTILIMATYRME